MNPAYFETRFRADESVTDWPREFVIVSAFATTGETWSSEQNRAGDRALARALAEAGVWLVRLTGYSPTSGHVEPGWAAELPLESARGIGRQFRQDAIYHVAGDVLSVTDCDERGALEFVGSFRDRLDASTGSAA